MIESVRFDFDLEQVDVARWLDIGQPGTRAVRQQWRAVSSGLAKARDDSAAVSSTEPRPAGDEKAFRQA